MAVLGRSCWVYSQDETLIHQRSSSGTSSCKPVRRKCCFSALGLWLEESSLSLVASHCLGPVDVESACRQADPDEAPRRCSADVMIEEPCPLVETARVKCIGKPQGDYIEVMAQLVAECAEQCSKGGGLAANWRAHPQPDASSLGIIISEEFMDGAFGDAARADAQHFNRWAGRLKSSCNCRSERIGG